MLIFPGNHWDLSKKKVGESPNRSLCFFNILKGYCAFFRGRNKKNLEIKNWKAFSFFLEKTWIGIFDLYIQRQNLRKSKKYLEETKKNKNKNKKYSRGGGGTNVIYGQKERRNNKLWKNQKNSG